MLLLLSLLLGSISLEQTIGQSLVIELYTKEWDPQKGKGQEEVLSLAREGLIGGVHFIGPWNEEEELYWTAKLKRESQFPLIFMQDCEWGFGRKVKEAVAFPMNGTLHHVSDLALLEEYGQAIGEEAKRLGIHLCFAPVLDINTNEENPIIGLRSFGASAKEVTEKGLAIARGIQKTGTCPCVKHFPGHGSVSVDSHHQLPTITQSLTEDLIPFKKASEERVGAMMVGHLLVPAVDSYPASLSKKWITDTLKKELNYKGLIVTDDMKMKALPHTIEEKAYLAYNAGNDLLLLSYKKEDILTAIDAIKEKIPPEEIQRRYQKISAWKAKFLEPQKRQQIDLNALKEKLYTQAIGEIAPLSGTRALFDLNEIQSLSAFTAYLDKDHLILTLTQPDVKYQRKPIPLDKQTLVNKLAEHHPSVHLILYCNPSELHLSNKVHTYMAYEDDPVAKANISKWLDNQ